MQNEFLVKILVHVQKTTALCNLHLQYLFEIYVLNFYGIMNTNATNFINIRHK